LLSALPLLSPATLGSTRPNQLTTVTYFTTATTLFTSSSYSLTTLAPSILYSGSFQIPQLSPPPQAGSCAYSVYSLGPFPASKGDKVSASGSTDYGLSAAIWPKAQFDAVSGFLNQPPGPESEAGCFTFMLAEDSLSSQVFWRVFWSNSSISFHWVLNAPDEYYLVLTTDGLNPANVVLELGLSPVYTSTISYTPTTTVTSIQGYWVGQAMIYAIVRNAFLIAGVSALVILCVVAFVLRRRRTPKHE